MVFVLYEQFDCFVKENNLFKSGDTVIAAVSGGADSMCLLHLLTKSKVKIICAHVNHNIRPDAGKDAEFVKSYCDKNGIEFRMLSANVRKTAECEKISDEMAGRKIRYEFFFKLKEEYGASVILTAHSKNDLCETVLLNLIRGSGMSGLVGFGAARGDGVMHPLIFAKRCDIEKYLISEGISWREDSTNAETDYTRNKIRHLILPEILKINSGFVDTAARNAEILRSENEYFENIVEQSGAVLKTQNQYRINIKKLLDNDVIIAKRIILSVLKKISANADYDKVKKIYQLAQAQTGKKIPIGNHFTAMREYNEIVIGVLKEADDYLYDLPEKGELYIKETGVRLTVSESGDGLGLKSGDYKVRKRKDGDRFSPKGLGGTKKIKDFMSDKKISRNMRDKIPLIVSQDKIVCVGDMRADKDFAGHDIYIKIKYERGTGNG